MKNPEVTFVTANKQTNKRYPVYKNHVWKYYQSQIPFLITRVHKSESNPDLQSVGLLSTDADLGDAAVPRNSQDPLRVPALRLSPVSGRKSYDIVPPVPLQDPHNTPCGFKIRRQYEL